MEFFLQHIRRIPFLLLLFISSLSKAENSEFQFYINDTQNSFPKGSLFLWNDIEAKDPQHVLNKLNQFHSDAPVKLSNQNHILWVLIPTDSLIENGITHLLIPNCHINYSRFFYLDYNYKIVHQTNQIGDRIAFSSRPIPFPEFIIPLNIQNATHYVLFYLDKSNEPFYTSLIATTDHEVESRKRAFFMISGIILGIIIAAFLLNLYIVLSTQSIINYLYSIFLGLSLIYTLSDFGYLHWVINNQSNWTIDIIRPLSISLAFPTYLFFLLHTLRLSAKMPKAAIRIKQYGWFWLTYVVVASSISPLLYDQSYKYYTLIISMLFQQITLIIVIWVSIKSFLSKDKFSVPFLITSILFVLVHVQHWAHQFGKINDSVINQHFLPIILAIDCILIGGIVAIKFINFLQDNQAPELQLSNKESEIKDRIAEIQLRELSRISQLLHNHIGVELMTLNAIVISNQREINPTLFQVLNEKSRSLMEDVRNTAHYLSPQVLKKFGLAHCIHLFLQDVKKSKKINYNSEISDACDNITVNTQLIVMLIIQECVNNTVKHAKASQIEVQCFIENNHVFISYSDNGEGFDENNRDVSGLGLMQIQEMIITSYGELNYSSSLGNGFRLEANLPLNQI
jgi:two-component system, sensor histidine kinase LadS